MVKVNHCQHLSSIDYFQDGCVEITYSHEPLGKGGQRQLVNFKRKYCQILLHALDLTYMYIQKRIKGCFSCFLSLEYIKIFKKFSKFYETPVKHCGRSKKSFLKDREQLNVKYWYCIRPLQQYQHVVSYCKGLCMIWALFDPLKRENLKIDKNSSSNFQRHPISHHFL